MAHLVINVEFEISALTYFQHLDLAEFRYQSADVMRLFKDLKQLADQILPSQYQQLDQKTVRSLILRLKMAKTALTSDLFLTPEIEMQVRDAMHSIKHSLVKGSDDLAWRLNADDPMRKLT